MTDKSVWSEEIPVPESLIQYVDEGVRDKLPPGTQVHGISQSGSSYWARTAKIDATDAAGNPTPFFMKVLQSDQGRDMVSAEYYAMSLLHSVMPDLVVEPVAWGSYTEATDAYFFLCRFHHFATEFLEEEDDQDVKTVIEVNKLPDLKSFPELVAEFHRRSETKPGGEFGFPITMYGGRNPQTFPVSKTWEECFSKGLDNIFDMEEKVQGVDAEMQQLREGLMTRVIPRLLRPLETKGRTVIPTLVHGDMWQGNVAVDKATGRPIIFDATPLYAHHEYEMGPWWPTRHRLARDYVTEYYKAWYGNSQPTGEFENRVSLYAIRFDLHASSLYKGNLRWRNLVKDAMRELLNKYPLGYEGYLVEKGLVPPVDQVAGNFSVAQANKETLVEEFRGTDMQARA